MNIIKSIRRLTKFEWGLWIISVLTIIVSSSIGSKNDIMSTFASLVGVTALIFVAKGDVLGQVLTVIFSVLYAIVSFKLKYYGEMITYVGMTAPMAVMSAISWLKHPYDGDSGEVAVAKLTRQQIVKLTVYGVLVTFLMYFVLKYFNTANLPVSTVSIATSFAAAYLTFCRSNYYAIGYALNDLVLIILWSAATLKDISYLPMISCFVMFLANDIYGFCNWHRIKKRQGA